MPPGVPPPGTPRPPPDRLVVGRVLGPWGVKGLLKVRSETESPHRFSPGGRLLIGPTEYLCRQARPGAGFLLVKLQGVDDRDAAAALRGALLEVPTSALPPPPPGAYYHHQVIGLRVVTADGRPLGRVEEILQTASNDVYVVNGPGGQVLVPAVADVVASVDVEAGLITIQALPGLLG